MCGSKCYEVTPEPQSWEAEEMGRSPGSLVMAYEVSSSSLHFLLAGYRDMSLHSAFSSEQDQNPHQCSEMSASLSLGRRTREPEPTRCAESSSLWAKSVSASMGPRTLPTSEASHSRTHCLALLEADSKEAAGLALPRAAVIWSVQVSVPTSQGAVFTLWGYICLPPQHNTSPWEAVGLPLVSPRLITSTAILSPDKVTF